MAIGPAARQAWGTIVSLMLAGEGRDRVHRASDEIGLPPGALKALFLLAARPRSMRDMAATFGCDPSYMTGLVDALERRDAARREPHPTDRRVKTVVITDDGRQMLARAREVLWEPPSSFGALSAAEQRHLADLVAKVAAADTEVGEVLPAATSAWARPASPAAKRRTAS
jgi:DNA-binding MarR family transcriptional regulator